MPKQVTSKRKRRTRATPSDFAVAFLITALIAVIVLAAIASVRGWQEGRLAGALSPESAPATVYETSSEGSAKPVAGPGADGALSLAAPSHDGRWLAWTGTRGSESGLWLADRKGNDPRLLVAGNPSPGARPAWSVDDQLIAWMERTQPGVGLLRVTEAASGSAAPFAELPCAEGAGVVWMPGTSCLLVTDPATDKLLVVSGDSGSPGVVAEGVRCDARGPGLRVGRSRLDTYALDDRSRHVLGSTERIAMTEWVEPSPDGQVVAVVEAPAVNARVVNVAVAAAGYETRPRYQRGTPGWVDNAPMPGFLSWSPDSTRLLYYFPEGTGADEPIGLFREDGEADAAVVERSHGAVTTLIHWPGDGGPARAAWIDDQRIAYLEGDPPGRLWIVDADSGDAALLWDRPGGGQAR